MKNQINTEETAVLNTVRQLTDLMIKRDTAAMNLILDKNFTLTHITDYIQPKEEWFEEITNEQMKYYAVKEVKHAVTINGNTATVILQSLIDARIWGSLSTWRLQQKMKLEKRHEQWIILKSIAAAF